MELLPAAERTRRALAAGIVLAALTAAALWPQAWAERLASALAAPLAAAAMPLAHLIAGPPPASPAPAPAPVASLAAVEEGLGRPPQVPATAWWPVPVVSRRATAWTLGAGSEFGLFEGQPVVFGRTWLGRLEAVEGGRAVLRLWTAPEEPTGAWLGDVGTGLQAICLGRKEGGEPLVREIQAGGEPADGLAVRWRGRAGDPPWFEQGAFQLGVLRRRGDESRREAYWTVEAEVPLAAEGRVYVGLGALPSQPPPEPVPPRSAARLALRADGVLGAAACAVEAPVAFAPPFALARDHRIVGPVVAARGARHWVVPGRAAAWAGPVIGLEFAGAGPRLVAEPAARAQDGLALYSRGGGGWPRGWWLGRVGEPAPAPGGAGELAVIGG